MAVIIYKGVRYDTLYGGGYKTGQDWLQQNESEIAVQPSPTKPQPSIVTESLSVTANGAYTAPEGKAYSAVSVNVPQPTLDDLNVTENGEYNGQFKKVTVNVPTAEGVDLEVDHLGTYTPPAGKTYKKVVVNGTASASITENGQLTGLYDNPLIAVPAAREEQILPPITENGTYTADPDKMFLQVQVAVPEAEVIYHSAQENLEFINVDIEVA